MSALHIPEITEDMDRLTAAMTYGNAGIYIGPTKNVPGKEGKRPGAILGKGWPRKTSRDPKVLASRFAGTDHGIFIHAGRSGLTSTDRTWCPTSCAST